MATSCRRDHADLCVTWPHLPLYDQLYLSTTVLDEVEGLFVGQLVALPTANGQDQVPPLQLALRWTVGEYLQQATNPA